jgi:hypothetical protein
LDDDVVHDTVRFVDVLQGAMAQSVGELVILFFGDVVMGAVEEFERFVVTSATAHVGVDRHMVGDVFTVIYGSVFDFADGSINFADSMFLFAIEMVGGSEAIEMSASVAQIGERMQVSRMPSWLVGEGEGGAHSNKNRDYSAMANSFHGFLVAGWPKS